MIEIPKVLLKVLVAWPTTWTLYWLGHVVSYGLRPYSPFAKWETAAVTTYYVYNKLMTWSADVQVWADLDSPWSRSL